MNVTARHIRSVVGALCAVFVLVLSASAAHAQYSGGPVLTVTPSTVSIGGTYTPQVEGFGAATQVSFSLDGAAIGTATADAGGVASVNATIAQGTTCGAHTVSATGTDANGNPVTLSAGITVTGCPAATTTTVVTSGALPVTGSNTGTFVSVGLALVAAGGLLVLVTRKRAGAA